MTAVTSTIPEENHLGSSKSSAAHPQFQQQGSNLEIDGIGMLSARVVLRSNPSLVKVRHSRSGSLHFGIFWDKVWEVLHLRGEGDRNTAGMPNPQKHVKKSWLRPLKGTLASLTHESL